MWTKSVLVTFSVVLLVGFGFANQEPSSNPGKNGLFFFHTCSWAGSAA
jgi:hypothetical protein